MQCMINTHMLELPLSRTYFLCSKGVRTTEVRLYLFILALLGLKMTLSRLLWFQRLRVNTLTSCDWDQNVNIKSKQVWKCFRRDKIPSWWKSSINIDLESVIRGFEVTDTLEQYCFIAKNSFNVWSVDSTLDCYFLDLNHSSVETEKGFRSLCIFFSYFIVFLKQTKVNQLLQLCTARTAWSDSVIRFVSLRFGYSVTQATVWWPMKTQEIRRFLALTNS